MDRPLIFLGDLHLGRRLTGHAEALLSLGLDVRELSPAGALRAAVKLAIEEDARALIFAGDVVDDEDDALEAFGQLERACVALCRAGIEVFAVAGNHDTLVLPRLLRRLPEMKLLGQGGVWERVELQSTGRAVDLLGWSFPTRTVRVDPTERADFQEQLANRRPSARLLGVLHGDLDRPSSPYAPVRKERLLSAGADAFLLGHIHTSDLLSCDPPVGYLGSVCALDPGEPGAHGVWRYLPDSDQLELIPLSPLRFEGLRLQLPALATQENQPEALDGAEAFLTLTREQAQRRPELRAGLEQLLLLRLVVSGPLKDRGSFSAFQNSESQQRIFELDGRPCLIESVLDESSLALDLTSLSQERSPAGSLASLLLKLDRISPLPSSSTPAASREVLEQGTLDADHAELLNLCRAINLEGLYRKWRAEPFALPDDSEARSPEQAESRASLDLQEMIALLRPALTRALELLVSTKSEGRRP